MHEMTNSNNRKVLLIASVVLVLVGIGVFTAVSDGDQAPPTSVEWETYVNEEYSFSIDYPAGWSVVESEDEFIVPVVTLVRDDGAADAEPPYDHFVNATYVSILPQGLGTEGLLGQTEETQVDFGPETENGRDFLLADGTVFATMANFPSGPEEWGQSGYVVARAQIEGLETQCERDGEEIPETACDLPMEEGADVVWYGNITDEDREMTERMLESFQFIESENSNETVE